MHFVSLAAISKETVLKIFDIADHLESYNDLPTEKRPLNGKNILAIFPETSVRTRITFELAITELGGKVISFPPGILDKKERLDDLVGYLVLWIHGIVVRHPDEEKIAALATCSKIPVINAMSKAGHPCEIVSDLYMLQKMKGDIGNLKFAFVGGAGNICDTWLQASNIFGFEITQICPVEYRSQVSGANIRHTENVGEIASDTDVLLTDGIPDEAYRDKCLPKNMISRDVLKRLKPEILVNPCPPFSRDVEIASEVIESTNFVGYDFKRGLLPVQKAILLYCFGFGH